MIAQGKIEKKKGRGCLVTFFNPSVTDKKK